MTVVASTFQTFQAIGNRESLADVIYNVSPEETPFMRSIGRGKAKATYEEWQTDSLAAASQNAQVQGDDTTFDAVTPTVRVGNRTQISKKSVIISGTQEVVDKAGRDSELSYQLAKKGAELKRDMEMILVGLNTASTAGQSATAAKLGSFESWITTNTSRAAGGASGGFSAGNTVAATDGSAAVLRAFSEGLLKPVLNSIWTNGGKMDVIMVGASNKQTMTTFPGIATQYRENSGVKGATILASAAVYVSDFGELKIVPNRFSRNRTALIYDSDYWSVLYLRPFFTEKLAKTGDAEKRHIIVEYTLKAHNEASSGVVADLS